MEEATTEPSSTSQDSHLQILPCDSSAEVDAPASSSLGSRSHDDDNDNDNDNDSDENDSDRTFLPLSSLTNLRQFFSTFINAKGTKAIVIVTFFIACGTGSVIGIVPDTMADRYARLYHGYGRDEPPCGGATTMTTTTRSVQPAACLAGTSDAQATAAMANVVFSLNALFLNPFMGKWTDVHGRRPMLLASVAVLILPAVALVAIMAVPRMHPLWYFLANSCLGAVNYLSLVLATLTDAMEGSPQLRAATFGLFLAVFYGGFSLAPSLPLFLNHFQTALVSLSCLVTALMCAIGWLPETLHETARLQAQEQQRRQQQQQQAQQEEYYATRQPQSSLLLFSVSSCCQRIFWSPLAAMSILGRSWSLRLLTASSFLSAAVFASDSTLVMYYMQEELDVNDTDISKMFVMIGILGFLLQGMAVQPAVQCWGERRVLVATFLCGAVHNTLYGAARHKKITLYVALALAQVTKLNYSVLASLASQHATPAEQGRMQGALAASNAMAYSVGPLSMEFVYHCTKNKPHFGPGFMFFYAGALYAMGAALVCGVPNKRQGPEQGQTLSLLGSTTTTTTTTTTNTDTVGHEDPETRERLCALQEPLLQNRDEQASQ